MNYAKLLVKMLLVAFAFVVVACGAQTTSQPVITPTETLAPISPTETRTPTPTLTATPEPTNTPTVIPTPIGGKSGLLLYQVACPQGGDCVQSIFLYDLVSNKLVPFLDGYTPMDVSPDGNKVLLKKESWETGDLFILDLSQPEQITLLQENVMDATWLGDSDWIGFISVSKSNAKRQVFIVHADGSDLTQVTNSPIGVLGLEPVFKDGVFWGEGAVGGPTKKHLWTTLDGTEKVLTNLYSIAKNGEYFMQYSSMAFF